jgi:hypothetical protein
MTSHELIDEVLEYRRYMYHYSYASPVGVRSAAFELTAHGGKTFDFYLDYAGALIRQNSVYNSFPRQASVAEATSLVSPRLTSRHGKFDPTWSAYFSLFREDDDHVKQYRNAAKNGRLLSQQVIDGWVKRDFGSHVIVEFETPSGVFDQTFGIEDFRGQCLPGVGTAVRLVSHLLTAPDLESDPLEDGGDNDEVRELKPQSGKSGEYWFGD